MRRKTILSGIIVIAVLGLTSIFLISEFANGKFGRAYLIGSLLGIVNGVIGFLTIEKFIDKKTLAFLRGVFVGMGVRMALLLGVFIILIETTTIDIAGMVTGLLIFYFTMTILEVIFLNKRINAKSAAKESLQ